MAVKFMQLIEHACISVVEHYGDEQSAQYSPASHNDGAVPSPHSRSTTPLEPISYPPETDEENYPPVLRAESDREFMLYNSGRIDQVIKSLLDIIVTNGFNDLKKLNFFLKTSQ